VNGKLRLEKIFRKNPITCENEYISNRQYSNGIPMQLTSKQLYSVEAILQSKEKSYISKPFTKDVFAVVQIKPVSNAGETMNIDSGSLVNNNRYYLGPVNLKKFSVKLLTDRGDVLNLKNTWSFTLVCEQLYDL
jgi:hypothetical protein